MLEIEYHDDHGHSSVQNVTIQLLAPLEITARLQEEQARPGDTVHLDWSVTGAADGCQVQVEWVCDEGCLQLSI